MTAAERLHMIVLLGAAAALVEGATFPNSSWDELRDDFLREFKRFRDA